jgi:hypothetical protein
MKPTELPKKNSGSCSLHRPVRMIMPSIYDDRLKDQCKGYIVDLKAKRNKTLVVVYGDTMEEMRELKHHIAECVRKFYSANVRDHRWPAGSEATTTQEGNQ